MTNNAALLGALRGPVVLIVLGILLTLHKFGDLSFWVSWPVLIIVMGVFKLLEVRALRTTVGETGL